MKKSERPLVKISLHIYKDQVQWFNNQHRINMAGFIRKALDNQIQRVEELK
jgi:hypothetical protein